MTCSLRETGRWPSLAPLFAVLVAALPSVSALAQNAQPEILPDAVSCSTCIIVARKVNTLGTADSIGYIRSGIHGVAVDGLGRFWVLSGEGPPLVFDSTGNFVREVGRLGRGPGEFVRPLSAVPVSGDSVLVVDGALRRATVVSASLAPGRVVQLPDVLRPLIVVTWPSLVVANGTIGTPSSIGWPLHLVAFDAIEARVVSSFGPDSGEVRPFEGPTLHQQLTRPRSGSFWSADILRYRLSRWSTTGDRLATLERRPGWFSTPSRFWIGNPQTPPPPAISAIAQDDDGLLWVFVRIPAPTWREVWPHAAEREYRYNELQLEKMFHTTIEVIDPSAKRVVARLTLPYWIIESMPGNRAAAYTVDSNGVPHVDIFAFEIARNRRENP